MVKAERVTEMAKELFKEERRKMRLDGWFLAKERAAQSFEKYQELSTEKQCAYSLVEMVKAIPLTISEYSIFVGTQDDSFARSYALINPAFKVEEFSGYCDPLAVFGDIEPSGEITKERIEKVKQFNEQTAYVKELNAVYADAARDTKEVAYFFEQVTGHLIPDLREALEVGVKELIKRLDESIESFLYTLNRSRD